MAYFVGDSENATDEQISREEIALMRKGLSRLRSEEKRKRELGKPNQYIVLNDLLDKLAK
jgi:hypothetical protein